MEEPNTVVYNIGSSTDGRLHAYRAFVCVAANTVLLPLLFIALFQNRPYFLNKPVTTCNFSKQNNFNPQ